MAQTHESRLHPIPLRLLYGVFFLSGVAALLYQLLWQRALFTIYGTNTESVTIVVAAFMLGLGLGSLAGGELSTRRVMPLPVLFAVFELLIGLYGLFSLDIFAVVGEATLGASLWMTGLLTFTLVAFPTSLMGATLPILVAFLVREGSNVGESVGSLYFINTLGSAFACFLGAVVLFRELGMTGSVWLAAGLNMAIALVIVAAWWRRSLR